MIYSIHVLMFFFFCFQSKKKQMMPSVPLYVSNVLYGKQSAVPKVQELIL